MIAAEAGYVVHWTPFSVTVLVILIIFGTTLFVTSLILTAWWCVDRNGRNLLDERRESKRRMMALRFQHEEKMADLEAQKYHFVNNLVSSTTENSSGHLTLPRHPDTF